ncbi:MAG TPA: ATP synthase F1 subunit gamma [Dehalococcoidia bacterium]|nr:ATP synthase F1 subunit gamma [Dehalococcoidia bacterium]
MASVRQIRRRVRSVTSIAKVTKAMELVAGSKMRRSQMRALQARPYALKLHEVLSALARQRGDAESTHPFLTARPARNALVVYMGPNRGLAGGLPSNMSRRAASFALEQETPVSFITVGRKARDFVVRAGQPLVAEFSMPDYPELNDTLPVSRIVVDEYLQERADRVFLLYPRFVNTAVQTPAVRQLLPIEPQEIAGEGAQPEEVDYIYEPGPEGVFESLLPRYVDMTIYQAVLESEASEWSARMVAMRNATEAANEMIGTLTLVYNKARQEQITGELLDIVGGVEAMKA